MTFPMNIDSIRTFIKNNLKKNHIVVDFTHKSTDDAIKGSKPFLKNRKDVIIFIILTTKDILITKNGSVVMWDTPDYICQNNLKELLNRIRLHSFGGSTKCCVCHEFKKNDNRACVRCSESVCKECVCQIIGNAFIVNTSNPEPIVNYDCPCCRVSNTIKLEDYFDMRFS